ncbi:MAG: glycosyltransferase family A protein [Burkholderiales bacterium]
MRVIAVFAHNEARKIIACLEGIKRDVRLGDKCVVLNNGSTDATTELVEDFSKNNDFCTLMNIEVGDKSNAWNVFVHEIRTNADVFCFLDGDCEILPGSLDALEKCMENNPTANAIAGIPADNVGKIFRNAMLRDGGLAGNLYVLSKGFVERIREADIRLPFGLIGDDSLVGALAYWDLNPKGSWDKTKIVICEGARFSYTPLSYFSFHDVRLYYRRKIRYSLRRIQINLMKKPLKEHGLTAIPRNVDELYSNYSSDIRLAWRGIETWFDWLAIRKIKDRVGNRRSGDI